MKKINNLELDSLSETIPIIFTHKGNALYLQLALLQAKKTCKSNVFLIGDSSNDCDYIKHCNINDYNKSSIHTEFKKHFKNLSPNSYDNELFCFERWFIILDFCLKNNIKESFGVDSDVLIYKDLNTLKDVFQNKDFSLIRLLGKFAGPQCSYFKTTSLEKYCNFILNFYKNRFFELENLYAQFKSEKNISGISDMVLLALYAEENPDSYIDFDYDEKRNYCFDENISCPAGFEFKNGKKNVIFKNNIPIIKRADSKKEVEFYMLHFQGSSKKVMEQYSILEKKEKKESPYYKYFKYKEHLQKLKKKLFCI